MLRIHGPSDGATPLVLDSPHSGRELPPDMRCAISAEDLRDGEDCFVDELWRPAAARGVPLLEALFPRTYVDANRHEGDIDLDLLEGGHWPHAWQPSGKAALGKALLWRTLDDGRPIYDRLLSVEETLGRIERCHRPYHAALGQLIDAAHARHGVSLHLNCHSMNAVGGAMGEGGAGKARADIVLGDRDGSTCDGVITAFVAEFFAARGYDVAVNDPFKGVELVRAFADPARGRHSLQLELNKRLYMQGSTGPKHEGFQRLQADLMALVNALLAALPQLSTSASASISTR